MGGVLRLGVTRGGSQRFDLSMAEISQGGIFLPGASGSGKTTTLARLCDSVLSCGGSVVIVNCKGTGLGGVVRRLAKRHRVPLHIVDPHDPGSLGYDPCTGNGATVANKVVGSFVFGGEAEIYKNIAMQVMPPLCTAMAAAGREVTLEGMHDALGKGGLAKLGRATKDPKQRAKLEDLEDGGALARAGYEGLRSRLGALTEGTYGDLFAKRPALDWEAATSAPAVTYLALSATAAGEDTELFGRVITQDLKQLCSQRMRAAEREEATAATPVLVCYDEFAALREAPQIVDLLLQARQAEVSVLLATQFVPEDIPIRQPALSAGVIITHRLEAGDAELVAAQFGTHRVPFVTSQVDYLTGESEKGSVRMEEEFDIHPNQLKSLKPGVAAVLSRGTQRKAVVQVDALR